MLLKNSLSSNILYKSPLMAFLVLSLVGFINAADMQYTIEFDENDLSTTTVTADDDNDYAPGQVYWIGGFVLRENFALLAGSASGGGIVIRGSR